MSALHVRGVSIPQDRTKPSTPLAYRIIKVTSIRYREWGLTECAPRVLVSCPGSRAHKALHAGVLHEGATDAWLATALEAKFC